MLPQQSAGHWLDRGRWHRMLHECNLLLVFIFSELDEENGVRGANVSCACLRKKKISSPDRMVCNSVLLLMATHKYQRTWKQCRERSWKNAKSEHTIFAIGLPCCDDSAHVELVLNCHGKRLKKENSRVGAKWAVLKVCDGKASHPMSVSELGRHFFHTFILLITRQVPTRRQWMDADGRPHLGFFPVFYFISTRHMNPLNVKPIRQSKLSQMPLDSREIFRATGRSTASSFGTSTSSPFVRSTSVDAAHSNKSANLPQLSHFLFEMFWRIVLKTAHESQGGNCLLLPCSHSERELKPQTLDAPFQQFNRVFNHNQHQKKKIIGCCSAKTKLPEDQASAEVLRF